jgi:hypothetical protein
VVLYLSLGQIPGKLHPSRRFREFQFLPRGHEVADGQALQVQQWQHLSDLRFLSRPQVKIAEANRIRSPVIVSAPCR